jgi:G:T-mismatch repair DNA endonuclease (very short patch repair protein)
MDANAHAFGGQGYRAMNTMAAVMGKAAVALANVARRRRQRQRLRQRGWRVAAMAKVAAATTKAAAAVTVAKAMVVMGAKVTVAMEEATTTA